MTFFEILASFAMDNTVLTSLLTQHFLSDWITLTAAQQAEACGAWIIDPGHVVSTVVSAFGEDWGAIPASSAPAEFYGQTCRSI